MEKMETIDAGELARYRKEHDDDAVRAEVYQFVREVRCALKNIRESFAHHKMIAAIAEIAFFGAMTYKSGDGTDDLTVAAIGCEKGMPAELAGYARRRIDGEAER